MHRFFVAQKTCWGENSPHAVQRLRCKQRRTVGAKIKIIIKKLIEIQIAFLDRKSHGIFKRIRAQIPWTNNPWVRYLIGANSDPGCLSTSLGQSTWSLCRWCHAQLLAGAGRRRHHRSNVRSPLSSGGQFEVRLVLLKPLISWFTSHVCTGTQDKIVVKVDAVLLQGQTLELGARKQNSEFWFGVYRLVFLRNFDFIPRKEWMDGDNAIFRNSLIGDKNVARTRKVKNPAFFFRVTDRNQLPWYEIRTDKFFRAYLSHNKYRVKFRFRLVKSLHLRFAISNFENDWISSRRAVRVFLQKCDLGDE